MRFLLMSFVLASFIAGPVCAQDAPVKEETPQAAPIPENPHIKEMNDKAQALAGSLTEEEAQTLGNIRDNFGVLRSVGIARKSVEEAVALCVEKNPELKDAITARHQTWSKTIGDALATQERSLGQALTARNFTNPAQVRDYLETIDKAAHYADQNIEKKVVTTPEACRNLMNSMDETQKTILDLITAMTWPEGAAGNGDATP